MDIAIIRRNGLGDLLCAYPLILYIQKNNPSSKISLFVDAYNAPLTSYLPPIDQVIAFPEKGNKYWNIYKTAFKFRGQFDLGISAKTRPMKLNNCFLYWLKAKERFAYVDSSWHRRLVNRPFLYFPEKAAKMHQALKGLQLIAPDLQEVPEEFYPKIHFSQEIKQRYQTPLFNQPVILLSATTTKASNRLAPERYSALLNRLYLSYPFTVLIIGKKEDEVRALAIRKGLKMASELHFPRNFDEFMVLLDCGDLFFVGDGGVAHLGAALGKHVLTLFGEIDPAQWSPLSKLATTLYHPLDVNFLSDESIFHQLSQKTRSICGRENM